MSSKKSNTSKSSNNKVSSSNNSKKNSNNSNKASNNKASNNKASNNKASNNKASNNEASNNKASNNIITKTIEDTSKNVGKTLEKNPYMVIILNLVLVLYILAIKNLSNEFLNMLDTMLFKLIMAFVVLLLSFSEPVSAILLTTAFVLSLNELNNRDAKNTFENTTQNVVEEESNELLNNNLNNNKNNNDFNLGNMDNGGCVGDYSSGDLTDRKCFLEVPQEKDHLLENTVVKDEPKNPSDNTLLENLALEDNKFRQLNSIGVNEVPSSNQNTAPQFLGNGLNAQGLNESIPGGFNSNNKYCSF